MSAEDGEKEGEDGRVDLWLVRGGGMMEMARAGSRRGRRGSRGLSCGVVIDALVLVIVIIVVVLIDGGGGGCCLLAAVAGTLLGARGRTAGGG